MRRELRVVVLGVGNLGLPICLRLQSQGHEVIGIDPSPSSRERAEASGLETRPALGPDVPADVAIVLVGDPHHLLEVTTGAGSVFSVLHDHVPVIVMSTVGDAAVREAAARAASRRRAPVIDCPVSGGVHRAREGELALFAAGDPLCLDAVGHLLKDLGELHFCGPTPGQGQAMKMVNQLLASVNMVVAAEALGLASALGIDASRALPALMAGAGATEVLRLQGPAFIDETRETGVSFKILEKDARLVRDSAEHLFPVPVATAARNVLENAVNNGLGDVDVARLLQHYGALNTWNVSTITARTLEEAP